MKLSARQGHVKGRAKSRAGIPALCFIQPAQDEALLRMLHAVRHTRMATYALRFVRRDREAQANALATLASDELSSALCALSTGAAVTAASSSTAAALTLLACTKVCLCPCSGRAAAQPCRCFSSTETVRPARFAGLLLHEPWPWCTWQPTSLPGIVIMVPGFAAACIRLGRSAPAP